MPGVFSLSRGRCVIAFVPRELARGDLVMRRFAFRSLFGAAVVIGFGSIARAGLVNSIVFYDGNPLYVQSVVGSGPDTAYAVLDLASGPNVAWQYNFDNSGGPVTAWTMLNDIATADPNLKISATFYPSFGNEWYVNNFQYGNAVGANNKWDFYTSSYSVADVSATDPQGTTGWTGIGAINTADLTDGEIFGGVDIYPHPPTPVLPETAAPVPEPAGLTLALFAGAALLRRRR